MKFVVEFPREYQPNLQRAKARAALPPIGRPRNGKRGQLSAKKQKYNTRLSILFLLEKAYNVQVGSLGKASSHVPNKSMAGSHVMIKPGNYNRSRKSGRSQTGLPAQEMKTGSDRDVKRVLVS